MFWSKMFWSSVFFAGASSSMSLNSKLWSWQFTLHQWVPYSSQLKGFDESASGDLLWPGGDLSRSIRRCTRIVAWVTLHFLSGHPSKAETESGLDVEILGSLSSQARSSRVKSHYQRLVHRCVNAKFGRRWFTHPATPSHVTGDTSKSNFGFSTQRDI